MKTELNKSIDILQLLTNKIGTIKQKANTFLTQDDYNILSGKIFQLQELLSGGLTDDGSNDRYRSRFKITIDKGAAVTDVAGQYYNTGALSLKNTKLYQHVDNSNITAYYNPDDATFTVYEGTTVKFSMPHFNPDDQRLPMGDTYTDGMDYKITIIG